MTIHQARDLAVKLFGVYCILKAVVLVPQLISTLAFVDENVTYVHGKASVAVTLSLTVLLYVFLGWLLVIKTETAVGWLWRSSSETPQGAPCSAPTLHMWIILIGLFYFIHSLAGVVSQLWVIGIDKEIVGRSFASRLFLPDIVLLPLSVFFIWKAKAIEDFITRRNQPPSTSNQQ